MLKTCSVSQPLRSVLIAILILSILNLSIMSLGALLESQALAPMHPLVKGVANTLAKSTFAKLLGSLVAKPTRDLIELVIGDHWVLLQTVLPAQDISTASINSDK